MKRLTLLSMILVAGMMIAMGQTRPAETDNPSNQKEVIHRLEMGIMFARLVPVSLPGKPQKIAIPDLNEVLADEYSRIDAHGRVITKQAELEKSRQTMLSQPCKGHIRDYRIIVLEDSAVVKSLINVESCDNRNFEPTGQYRVTNIYARRQAKWQLISSQWTTVDD
ncbi:MAG: nuclear transport factor 2 family protein [Blastocatellia bacterium]|nr:nuclear transport factor 2 family protein [Blastocatellia bacterium]